MGFMYHERGIHSYRTIILKLLHVFKESSKIDFFFCVIFPSDEVGMTSYQRFNLLNHGKWIIIITSVVAVICLIVIVECFRRHNKPKQASPTNKGMVRDVQGNLG